MRREHGVERALGMTEMQQQRRRHEDHAAQRGQQGEVRDRAKLLQAEHLIQARNREGAGHQPGEIGIDDDQHAPRENRLVGVDVAGERRGRKSGSINSPPCRCRHRRHWGRCRFRV